MTSRVLGIFSCINDGIIGYDGKLMFTHPEDFSHFKEITMDKTLLVGYRTAKEIFDRNPEGLKGRKVAVLVDPSRQDFPDHKWKSDVDIVTDPISYINKSIRPIVVAGGKWVFDQLWCHVTQWHITHYAISMDEIFYKYDENKVSKFVVPGLPLPIDERRFKIKLPSGEEREAIITAHLM